MKTRTRQRTHSKRELEESGKKKKENFIIFHVVCFALTYHCGRRKVSKMH